MKPAHPIMTPQAAGNSPEEIENTKGLDSDSGKRPVHPEPVEGPE